MLSATNGTGNGMTMLLLVLCATVVMVLLLRRHQFRRTTGRDVVREQIARLRDQHRLHQSMDELLVQLEEASRRIGAQIDTKFAKLEAVIRDADDRIARLERASGLLKDRRSTPIEATEAVAGAAEDREDLAVQTPSPAMERPGSPDRIDPRLQRVYELVDEGATPIKAAEALGMPLGEVELILNLRKYH
jgi:hypothetical protein